MIGIVLVFSSTFLFALSAVLIMKDLNQSNFFAVSLVIIVIANIILWPLSILFTKTRPAGLDGLAFFAIGGIVEGGIAKLLHYKGMEVVGVSVTAAVSATAPIFSSILAMLLLSERVSPMNWIGTICIVTGVIFIQRNLNRTTIISKKVLRKSLIYPLLGALILAISLIIRKHGLNIYNEPLLSVAISSATTLPFYILLLTFSSSVRNSLSVCRDFRLFWKAAVFIVLGTILASFALSNERISIVVPLSRIEPLVILLFSYLFLREVEPLSINLTLNTVLIVLGTIIVSLS